jgi:hypothetical protein
MGAKEFTDKTNILRHYPADTKDNIISKANVTVDKEVNSDGIASLKINASEPILVKLFETDDIDVEDAKLVYQAKVKAENFKGQAYLEMWCHFDERGSYFSRDLATPIFGDTDWVTEETPFFLKKGENPDNVSLNIVINGTGTIWIDDVKLLKEPLK